MATARGYSLLIHPDQWARCVHDETALLAGGGVELTWADPTARQPRPGPGRVPSGLAFDRWCRAYRSRPGAGRVDVADGQPGASRPGALRPRPAWRSTGASASTSPRPGLAWSTSSTCGRSACCARSRCCGRPVDVAADCGRAVVLTSAPALVIIDGRRGPVPGPPLVRPCYPGGLAARRIAAGPLVLWVAEDGRCAIARPDGSVLLDLSSATDLDVGSGGLLVIGCAPGQALRRFQMDGGALTELEPAEALNYDGGAVCIAPDGRIAFTTKDGYGWTSGSAAQHVPGGSVVTYRLDSTAYRTRWGRLFVDACLPAGTWLGARFVTTDDDVNVDPVEAGRARPRGAPGSRPGRHAAAGAAASARGGRRRPAGASVPPAER